MVHPATGDALSVNSTLGHRSPYNPLAEPVTREQSRRGNGKKGRKRSSSGNDSCGSEPTRGSELGGKQAHRGGRHEKVSHDLLAEESRASEAVHQIGVLKPTCGVTWSEKKGAVERSDDRRNDAVPWIGPNNVSSQEERKVRPELGVVLEAEGSLTATGFLGRWKGEGEGGGEGEDEAEETEKEVEVAQEGRPRNPVGGGGRGVDVRGGSGGGGGGERREVVV
ncbi:unnamed protein product [Musa acuminata subsp. burmannicoides]